MDLKINPSKILSTDKQSLIRLNPAKYSVEVIDIASQMILHKIVDHSGKHRCATFTEDSNKVIFITFDHHWYLPPTIKIWDLKNNKLSAIATLHDVQCELLTLCYQTELKCLIVGDHQGEFSAYDIETKKQLWHQNQANNKTSVIAIAISDSGKRFAILQENEMSLYELSSAKKLSSTPLKKRYLSCFFVEQDNSLVLLDNNKTPLRIELDE